jgi:hypothetical protein
MTQISRPSADSQVTEIIFCDSTVPVIRGGISNVLFLVLFAAIIGLNQSLKDLDADDILRILSVSFLCLLTMRVYVSSVSRLYVKNGNKLVLVNPIRESVITISEIEKTQVSGIPSSMIILLTMKCKTRKLPRFHFMIAVSTNLGGYEDTRMGLISFLDALHENQQVG